MLAIVVIADRNQSRSRNYSDVCGMRCVPCEDEHVEARQVLHDDEHNEHEDDNDDDGDKEPEDVWNVLQRLHCHYAWMWGE